MNTRPGMSCSDCHLTDAAMHAGSANDDTVDVFSAADLMGTSVWLDYVERWNPLRYQPSDQAKLGRYPKRAKRRSA